jgi:hypothetical protein
LEVYGFRAEEAKSSMADGQRCPADCGHRLGYLVIGGKDSGAVHADSGIKTEQAAADAGAKVRTTDPKLKIEPK